MNALRTTIVVSVMVLSAVLPTGAFAWVEYGAFYTTPEPYSQMYYQPMYAYASSPVLNYQSPQYASQYSSYPSYPNYSYPSNQYYGNQYYMPQYTYSASYPQFNNTYPQAYPQIPPAPYGQNVSMYGTPVPYNYGYPTGDSVPLIGGPLCTFPDYEGRALCGSNPSQRVYDSWTGSWY